MSNQDSSRIEKSLATLVSVTDALLRGDFMESVPEIDAEGLLSVLAQKINVMLANLKTLQVPLSNAGAQAPFLPGYVRDVIELMEQSTGSVLDKADRMIVRIEEVEQRLRQGKCDQEATLAAVGEMKLLIYDIIASQSYQDAARQKMEKLMLDLNQLRDWLIEVLVILNIKKDGSVENLEKKKELLREVHAGGTTSSLKQDLVDELLSEYGF